jgi:tRNA threonylcarbamoyladenosine biosynthesis protein TsaE
MLMYEKTFSLNEIDIIAKEVIEFCGTNKKIYFYGEMGTGKTTLIKALCKQIKVEDLINSPSFSIINEYMTIDGDPVYHFDFYRIKDTNEVFDLGYEEYLYGKNYCFVEWPEKIEGLIPMENRVNIYIKKINNQRNIKIYIQNGL